jgi:NAD(P)-dependent dehydrogenase (short-subunit alcohol dehydrogenase family)
LSVTIDLGGRPCLVVGGAGGGIGAATTMLAAEAGSPVGVISHNAKDAAEIEARVASIGGRCVTVIGDVLEEAELVDAIARVQAELGTIRHLVNVIGGAGEYEVHTDFQMSTLHRLAGRNLYYAVISCREVARGLIAAGETGSMVNISSGASEGSSTLGSYGAAKAGLESFSRTMALEWGYRGIRVNVVRCGVIRVARTPKEAPNVDARIPLRRRGEAPEIAATAIFLLSDLSGYTTGQVLAVDGGMSLGGPGGEDIPAGSVPHMTNKK